jgi:PAS domain S-box-containing protein
MALFRDSSDAVISFHRRECQILTVNPRTESLFGYHGTDLIGQSAGLLIATEPGRPGPAPYPDTLPGHLFDGLPHELLGRRAEGTAFPIEVLVTEVDLGLNSFYIASFRELTGRGRHDDADLRASEARFRAAVETLGEGLLITDTEDVIVYVNSRITQISGYAPEEMIGQPIELLLVPDEERESYQQHKALRLQGMAEHYEMNLRRKDGQPFWADVNGSLFRDADGQVVGTLVALMDVTERKRIEQELVAAVDAAEDASRAKSAFRRESRSSI